MRYNDLLKQLDKKKGCVISKDIELYADISNLVTEARLYAGLTQAQLAKKLRTKQPSIARIESGNDLPSLSFLLKIAKAVGSYMIAPKFGFMLDVKEANTKVNPNKSSLQIIVHQQKTPHKSYTMSPYISGFALSK